VSRKTKPGTTSYLLRNVPQDLWQRAQAQAVLEGVSMRVVLLQLLKGYTKRKR